MALITLLLLPACNELRLTKDDGPLRGAILVWYSWPQPDQAVIEELLERFRTINPDVTVVGEFVPIAEMGERFKSQAAAGLGPDVLIGMPSDMLADLGQAGLLMNLKLFDLNSEDLLPQTVEALTMNEGQFGLPFSATTDVLYYNKDLVTKPSNDLAGLLEEAQGGQRIAIPIDFYHSFWGVTAFDGQVVTEEGEIIVDEGFISWLQWLQQAQEDPNLIFNSNYQDLLELFTAGQAAYFVGRSLDFPLIREALGEEQIGVTLLPLADDNRPGSYLELEAVAISRVSAERRLSLELVSFLTNETHQRLLGLSNLGRIPIHSRLRFDSRVFPLASTLTRQRRQSVIVPLVHIQIQKELIKSGDVIYLEVLGGVLEPEEAAARLRDEVTAALAAAEAAEEEE